MQSADNADAAHAGRCSEAERDRIEAQVGLFVRACTENIARLEASVQQAGAALNPHMAAHRHGVVRCAGINAHA